MCWQRKKTTIFLKRLLVLHLKFIFHHFNPFLCALFCVCRWCFVQGLTNKAADIDCIYPHDNLSKKWNMALLKRLHAVRSDIPYSLHARQKTYWIIAINFMLIQQRTTSPSLSLAFIAIFYNEIERTYVRRTYKHLDELKYLVCRTGVLLILRFVQCIHA